MTDRSSRYTQVETYRRAIPGRKSEVEIYAPRIRRTAEPVRYHTFQTTDRLDLLAHHYLGDPHQYWRIADANTQAELDELQEPGRRLSIPERP